MPDDVVTCACENCVLVLWGASNTTSKEEININFVAYTTIKAITNTNCRQRSRGILREMGMVIGAPRGVTVNSGRTAYSGRSTEKLRNIAKIYINAQYVTS